MSKMAGLLLARMCVSSTMKPLLHEFINWLEECHLRRSLSGSAFEALVEPALVAKAGIALDWAVASRKPVQVYTSTRDPRPLLAALILERARVDLGPFYRGELDDSAFPRLTRCVGKIAKSHFQLVPGEPPEAVAQSAFFGGPLFAVFNT